MNKVSFILIFTFVFAVTLFAACVPASPSVTSSVEIAGNRNERVASVTAILSKVAVPPTPILDAHLLEERIGDGNLGPSDVRTYIQVEIAPDEMVHWQGMLTTLTNRPSFVEPADAPSWWIDEAEFETLDFYELNALLGGNGWIAFDVNRGAIFIYSFST